MYPYKAMEKLEQLRQEKLEVLDSVYQGSDLNAVYHKQSLLGSMTVTVLTEAANAVLSALPQDGVTNLVWTRASLQARKLSFISIPTAEEIQEKYRQCVASPTVVDIPGELPKRGTRTNIARIPLPGFILALAAQGIAVPLLVSGFSGPAWALVKLIPCTVNAALIGIEIVCYYKATQKGKNVTAPRGRTSDVVVNCADMYARAIRKVQEDNRQILNQWFVDLEAAVEEEIRKEKAKQKTEE